MGGSGLLLFKLTLNVSSLMYLAISWLESAVMRRR
jgi:hypothetical protein